MVLSTITQADGRAALLVLDAASWRELARAVLPLGLPCGLHACWAGKGQLGSMAVPLELPRGDC